MIANYHTHTYRCNHARGTAREYVETAIQNGLKILGFSDHVPYPFRNGYTSRIRMAVKETGAYVQEIAALREEYRGQITIHIGYEAEFYPADFQRMLDNVRRHGCEYLILGQHYIGNEWESPYSGSPTQDRARLTAYVDLVLRALDTEKFSYIAHPDLINYRGDRDIYVQEMRRLCEGAKAHNIPLEVNLLGLAGQRQYPNDTFWRTAAETGNDAILGCDAHAPEDVADSETVENGYRFLDRFGLVPLETMQFRPV